MSETDKTTFISDNADLFSESNGGAELLKALESNDYNTIMAALSNNANMQERTSKLQDEIDQEIKVEEARVGDARNEAYIA
jgi:hypothetical protein